MTELVDPTEIEGLVGAKRHLYRHYGRAVSEEQRVYILHSQQCLKENPDLRKCEYSQALDLGIRRPIGIWEDWMDMPVILGIRYATQVIVPVGHVPGRERLL